MSSTANREIATALANELALVIGALLESPADVMPGAPGGGGQWLASLSAGDGNPVAWAALDADAATAMTSLIMGLESPAPAAAVIDTLREVFSQALGSLSLKPVVAGATLKLADVTGKDDVTPGGEWLAFTIAAPKLPRPATLLLWGTFAGTAKATVKQAPQVTPPPAAGAAAGDPSAERIDVILDIDLPLIVRFGRTELPLRNLARLGPGSLIDLGRSPDDPVEILVSNRVVAHGEVVIVAGNYGIRILDVVSPRDRIGSMGD